MGMAGTDGLLGKLAAILGPDALLTDPAARHVYGRDASHLTLGAPLAVALPREAGQVSDILQVCALAGVAVVCRGTGTGLSGGAVPPEGALVLSTARLNGLGAVDPGRCQVRCGPGVLNDRVSAHARPFGLHFAPDPSSQSAASIGGNIAENAGGPHCLRHGVTLRHVRGLQWCDARGRRLGSGRGLPAERGFHLTSLLCGSEGTLGVVTGADLALVPDPQAVATLLAFFPRLDDATAAVVSLLGRGLLPVAVEMVDQAMLLAVEEAFGFGFPTDVEAAMICELAGPRDEVDPDAELVSRLLAETGAREVRRARDEAERLELWKCRKKAFGAVGRLAPRYVTMDVVVPLGQLPGLVRRIQEIKAEHGVEIATAFHAGDGNLHPGVHYDDRDPDLERRAHQAADAIIAEALRRGGSCTGEHGVGLEKLHAVPWQIDAEDARLQTRIKQLFDPRGTLNPGKMLPPPGAEFAPMRPLPRDLGFAWDSLTVTAPAETPLDIFQQQALQKGLWVPVGLGAKGTVADLFDHLLPGPGLLAGGTGRDFLLEIWAETGDGRMFHGGAPVFKNVVGYDLPHALCGSGGHFVTLRWATFQLSAAPRAAGLAAFDLGALSGSLGTLLPELTALLTRHASGTAGCQLVVDRQGGRLLLLTSGRNRQDLQGQASRILKRWPELVLAGEHSLPFAEAPRLLEHELAPGWLAGSGTWTWHARTVDQAPAPVPPLDRLMWQSAPGLWWSPGAEVPARPGWYGETLLLEGRITPVSEPDRAAPLDLLRGLKKIFDPRNALGGPDWLTGGEPRA
jgi:glycolate oxidase